MNKITYHKTTNPDYKSSIKRFVAVRNKGVFAFRTGTGNWIKPLGKWPIGNKVTAKEANERASTTLAKELKDGILH